MPLAYQPPRSPMPKASRTGEHRAASGAPMRAGGVAARSAAVELSPMRRTESTTLRVSTPEGKRAAVYVSACVDDGGTSLQLVVDVVEPDVAKAARAELTRQVMALIGEALMRAQTAGLPVVGGGNG